MESKNTKQSAVKNSDTKQIKKKVAAKKVNKKTKEKKPMTKEKKERIVCWSLIAVLSISAIVGIGLGFRPRGIDPYNYNYSRFDDEANFKISGIDDSDWNGVKAETITDGYEKGSSRAPQTSEYGRTLSPTEIIKPINYTADEHEKYGVEKYPSYGSNLGNLPVEKFNGIILECRDLIPSPTWHSSKTYDAIDSEGYLLKNGNRIEYTYNVDSSGSGDGESSDNNHDGDGDGEDVGAGSATTSIQYHETYRMLYKHTTAETLYGGGFSDSEPRIVKTISCVARGGAGAIGSKQITGLYAPAGEVIKFEMPLDQWLASGGMRIYIGQNYNLDGNDGVSLEWSVSGGTANIKGNGFTRMPNIVSQFNYPANSPAVEVGEDTVTFYAGSFWGGPIYIRPNANNVQRNISVTISGGVKYQHFILGATTEEEYNLNATSTAPYFDLEIYDSAIRFTTGKWGAESLSSMTYENCTDAAVLWDKITQVSRRVGPNGLTSKLAPINFIGDCYIAAGAAYANPGRNGVVCPPGWVAGALNYNSFVNGGNWGSMHEFNHCWQGYGVANNGEVTNNAVTLVSYSLYTRISQSRTAVPGWSPGWNRFTDPSKALAEFLTQSSTGNKCYDLPLYATLLHNIGQENYITSAQAGSYYDNLVNATHYDMTYYFKDLMHFNVGKDYAHTGTLSSAKVQEVKSKNYPVFVPVSSVYQVGRSVIYDKQKYYITTAQPFSYGSGVFIMDFNNRNNFKAGNFISKGLVIPDGFTASVVSVTQPENGKVELLDNNYVKYTPSNDKDSLYSGNFRVKIRLIHNKREFIVEDVDLVINLKQSAGTDLTRTTYIYNDASKVPSTSEIYNAQTKTFDFGDVASTESKVNVCTQETNTQIWAAGRNYDDDHYDANSKNYRLMPVNQTLQTLDGVMYLSRAGTYRFTLKGRGKATLYLSYDDGNTWESAFTFNRKSGNAYNPNEYTEHEFTTTNNYIKFKVVLLVTAESDFFGIGVSMKNNEGTFPAFANASAILNADIHKALLEESTKKFETEYLYKNEYKFTYANNVAYDAAEQSLVSVSHAAWDDTRLIDFLFDGRTDTYYHTVAGQANYITEEKPLELVANLGQLRKVNAVTFNFYINNFGNNGMPVTFKLYGSKDGQDFSNLLVEKNAMKYPNNKPYTFTFDETEIMYYKLVVTDTDNHRYFAMASINFAYNLSYQNGKHIAPNDFSVRYIGAWDTENVLCNFGLIYKANAGDSVEFHFTGTRFAYLAYQAVDYGTVDVYVDGKLFEADVSLSADKNVGSLAYMYLGEALKNTDHVVKIVGKTGKFNVDSFVYWA